MILKIISKNEQCITSAFKTITKKTHEIEGHHHYLDYK